MTNPARRRFLSLGASISRLTWARDSSPLMARSVWPKAMRMPSAPMIRGKFSSQPLEDSLPSGMPESVKTGWSGGA